MKAKERLIKNYGWTEGRRDGRRQRKEKNIYTDFLKAFDSVPHRRLVQKLESCGVRGNVLMWVKDFLANRMQRVVINGTRSSEGNVTSGIPQGSVLGPLLFVIYINDLPRNLNTVAKMFADDTKVYVRSDTQDGAKNLH